MTMLKNSLSCAALLLALTGCEKEPEGQPIGSSPENPHAMGESPHGQGMPTTAKASNSAAGITWKAPERWEVRPGTSSMRAATYAIPGPEGAAELAVYYFGVGQGGGLDANVRRWIGQFEKEGGGVPESNQTEEKVAGLDATRLDVSGVFNASMGPYATGGQKKPDSRMLAAIVEAPQGPVFFKMVGPAKTVEGAKEEFDGMLSSITKDEAAASQGAETAAQ